MTAVGGLCSTANTLPLMRRPRNERKEYNQPVTEQRTGEDPQWPSALDNNFDRTSSMRHGKTAILP
jgi:hypothetical protein